MSEKEKVMTVTLMRSDLYYAPAYSGAYLKLPASQGEIQDAMDCARIKDGQPYKILECFNSQGDELAFIPVDPSLAELNFLAYRISKMNDHDRIAFTGCAMMGDGHPSMQSLVNLSYSLNDAHVVFVKNDRELGKFYVDNDFIDAVNHVPPEYQKEILEWLDYEKIGRHQREAEGGIYHDGYYVVNTFGTMNTAYDGVHLPELQEEPPYVFKLQLAEADFEMDNLSEPEHCVNLLLPATDKEILTVLEQLSAASLDECVFYHCESPIPALEQAFSFSEDIDKMNLLAKRICELDKNGELPKFKAALEIDDCSDMDQALDLTRNLNCYDFYPELSSMEDYAKQEFLNRYHIPESDSTLKLIYFSCCDPRCMEARNAVATPYGIIHRNDQEMTLEYSSPGLGQQML
ncbi:MAG: hypothetical protein WCD89_05940 [Anaerocolumna sp.]